MLVIFLLGFILDFIEITFVVVPIVGPVLMAMGVDPIWLGVLIAVNSNVFPNAALWFCFVLSSRVAPTALPPRRSIEAFTVYRPATTAAGPTVGVA